MKIAAGIFKAQCLQLMDRVSESHESLVITKHGKPVVRVVPITEEPDKPLFGYLQGKANISGDIVSPTGDDWEASR